MYATDGGLDATHLHFRAPYDDYPHSMYEGSFAGLAGLTNHSGNAIPYDAASPVAPVASYKDGSASLFCGIVKGYVTALHEQSAATAYCASLLSITIATSTTTKIVTSTLVSVATVYTSTPTTTTSVQLTCGTPQQHSSLIFRRTSSSYQRVAKKR
ncbi:hypothetical protein DOTSEDRAFT_39068 [Dothistroma septosporum NZE10]|uniref:Uncharacterized protein n=1 Tax=Dothistroma septosporum (strain NZE10 / CBS 128990) TaxID=675120 RepID=M2YIV1_DOTSN|nr:hypothetical protein DOTSEDRAFT_39068 [Dothistroma septosporum NZE10]